MPRNSKRKINILITKSFSYPVAMLESDDHLREAKTLCAQDLTTDLDAAMEAEPIEYIEKMFTMEAVDEIPFELRNNTVQRRAGIMAIPRNNALSKLSTFSLTKELGELDYKINPHLFDVEKGVSTADGKVILTEKYYLKNEIEEKFQWYYNQYANILEQLQQ